MMQVLSRWKITVIFDSVRAPLVLYFSDNYISNVLRKLADVSFELEPASIAVQLELKELQRHD